jgi:photosystem II stability/assembly factor-like uncharacterized protein
MRSRILIIVLFIASILPARAQWAWQNPLPQGNDILSVFAFDSLHVCSAGAGGTIMTTFNAGQSWHLFQDTLYRTFFSVGFRDTMNGWAIGDLGARFKSHDGGVTWINASSDSLESFLCVSFLDSLNGWMTSYSPDNYRGKILKTSDGGATWDLVWTSIDITPRKIKFTNLTCGYFYGEPAHYLYYTTDGGNSWDARPIGEAVNNYILDFDFTSPNKGCIVTTLEHLKTTIDGGVTWTPVSSAPEMVSHVLMTAPDTFFISGNYYLPLQNPKTPAFIGKSTDTGNTWTITHFREPEQINALCRQSSRQPGTPILWITGNGGSLFRSVDENITWQPITRQASLASINSIYFDKNFPVGWAVTSNGYILKTSDGGNNWVRIETGDSLNLSSVCFLDTLKGFVAGDNGILMQTTDGGRNWTRKMPNSRSLNYIDMIFADAFHGWVLGKSGEVIYTSNGGDTWAQISKIESGAFYGFTFSDCNHGWATGNKGDIWATQDAGFHWVLQQTHVSLTNILDISFTDSLYGWCTVLEGFKLHTTDGGNTWIAQGSMNNPEQYFAVKFVDRLNGFMTIRTGFPGWLGMILKTTDGGINWKKENITMNNPILTLFANDTTAVYGSSINGIIIKYTGSVMSVNEIAKKPSLTCYPDPFTDNTRLRWESKNSGTVSIQVFDAKGRIVLLFPERTWPAGENSVVIDLKGHPPGCYYIRVQTPGKIFSGKMIKL